MYRLAALVTLLLPLPPKEDPASRLALASAHQTLVLVEVLVLSLALALLLVWLRPVGLVTTIPRLRSKSVRIHPISSSALFCLY